jgi:hypothetical protein
MFHSHIGNGIGGLIILVLFAFAFVALVKSVDKAEK